ncbi:5-hydroxytryptamine receptor 3A-like [Periophthalmus magnuspinnatus]|uniref:5-hydroxytryptamine receptor 3A-like n=1 Tax=Periophthalmus magnuspinnatus TaxID=409849 RepID=UPI00145A9A06|nr:5-hydroxytryptamine receptor 3A-like [Periophthalmus magnuspinnatus]
MFTRCCILLLFTGGALGSSIVRTRPKGNSRPKPLPPPPPPPAEPPAPGLPGTSWDGPQIDIEMDLISFMEPCTYEDLAQNLKLKTTEKFQMFRPVKNHSKPILIYLEMVIYAIIDVRETDQTCITSVLTYMSWVNENIEWNPENFCGLNKITVPSELLWKPDISIEESVQKGSYSVTPYISIYSDGLVEALSEQVVSSACKMQVYKFPFDTQSCTLTFKSAIYSDEELNIAAVLDSEKVSSWTRNRMKTQFEWVFIDMSVSNDTVPSFEKNQDVIIYTINMRRRAVLYIVNFILPVLFFLFLDFASFLMSDTGGEKLGFKITVLLAVTVMQLLLNEILPSSSNRIPLIAVYCIGIFSLMLLSLLESILVLYLITKESENTEPAGGQALKNKCLPTSEDFLSRKKSSVTDDFSLDLIASELKEVKESLSLMLSGGKEEEKPSGYWACKTKSINRYFFVAYFCCSFFFLLCLFIIWIY